MIRPGNNGDSEATEKDFPVMPRKKYPLELRERAVRMVLDALEVTLVPAAASSAGSATNSV